jgi:hypothetical protein
VVRIQTTGIGFVNGTIVVPATVGQRQFVSVEVRLHRGKLVGAVGHVLVSLVGAGGTYAHDPPVIPKHGAISFRWKLILVQYLVVLVWRYKFPHDIHPFRGLAFSLVHFEAYTVGLVQDLL